MPIFEKQKNKQNKSQQPKVAIEKFKPPKVFIEKKILSPKGISPKGINKPIDTNRSFPSFVPNSNSKTAEENYKDFIQIYNNSARQDKSMYHELAHGIGHKIEEPSLVTKTPDAVIDGKTYSSQK